MNAVVYADGFMAGGRDGAKRKLHDFWLSVSEEGSLSPAQRRLFDTWLHAWGFAFPQASAIWEALSQFAGPYEFNPLNVNPLRDHLSKIVDFAALRGDHDLQLFIAATNVHTGRGEIFRRDVLTADHVMASACLPTLFQAVVIDGVPYWDGGFAGNPPLWPLYYETDAATPSSFRSIRSRATDAAHAAGDRRPDERDHLHRGLLAELRATHFVARLIDQGVLRDNRYRRERLHRIGGDGKLEASTRPRS